jgi:hypothetical protein
MMDHSGLFMVESAFLVTGSYRLKLKGKEYTAIAGINQIVVRPENDKQQSALNVI